MSSTVVQSDARDASVRARVPEEVKRRWQSAAAMQGQTLTDFLIVAANRATAEVFAEHEKIELSQRDQVQVAEMLLRPPRFNASLQKAIRKRLEHMKDA